MKKRFLSLCMAVAMLLSCLCITPAAAADNGLRVQSVAQSEELIRQTSFLGLDSYVSLLKIYGDVSDDLAAPYDYVMVPGYGADSDYEGIDVTGKIAVVQGGGTDENGEPIAFVTKIQNALWKNAIGILVYNNDTEHPDDYSIRMSTNYYQLPAAFISYNAAQKLAAKAGSGVGITPTTELTAEPNLSAGQMSTFTSIGATPDLRIKPELSAVGGNVYSSIPTVEGKGDYASMSGTSMASPYVAGASVLVKSYMAENWTGSYDAASMTENLMMSTASPVVDPETKLPYSPRLQGSGLIDLSAATSSDVVLYTDADQYGDTKPVLNLGDDVAKNGSYDLTFRARNMGKDAARYDVSVIAMSPAVLEQDGKTYMSSHDEALDVTVSGDKTVTLAAGATGGVKVSVSLSQSQKAKLDAAYENGIYVEGFVVLTAKDGSADLSIPFLAYYGDWSAPGMLDYATMLNEDTVPYSQLATELGAYFTSSFAYRLGANLSVTMDGTEKTSLKAEHITVSPNGDTYMDGVELVSVSQMRNASALHFTVTDADGQEVWSDAVTNVPKTIYVSSQGGPIPATMYQDMAPDAWYGTDNQGSALPDGQYYYTITADPVTDHESRNVRDTLTFPVYIDTQAPQLDQGCVTLSTGADGRTTLGMQVSDEHLYLDTEIFVANDDGTISTSSEKLLHKNVGLADMPDVTSDAVSVDVTALHTGTGMVRALLNTGDYALIAVEVTCDHDHTTRTETPAACTQDGSVTVTCDDCGTVLSTEAIPATGHDYKDGKRTVCSAADPDYRPEQPENPGQPEKPEKPEQPENPGVKTGDSGVLLYMGLMLLALTGSAWVLRKKRAR